MTCKCSTKRRTDIPASAILLATLLVMKAAVAAPGASAIDSWPSFRGSERQTGVAGAPVAEELQLLWTAQVDGGIASTAAIAAGVVYVGGLDSTLSAFLLDTGERIWTYPATAAVITSPAIAAGILFFGDEAGVFHAIDAVTGASRWSFTTAAKIASSPNVADGARRLRQLRRESLLFERRFGLCRLAGGDG